MLSLRKGCQRPTYHKTHLAMRGGASLSQGWQVQDTEYRPPVLLLGNAINSAGSGTTFVPCGQVTSSENVIWYKPVWTHPWGLALTFPLLATIQTSFLSLKVDSKGWTELERSLWYWTAWALGANTWTWVQTSAPPWANWWLGHSLPLWPHFSSLLIGDKHSPHLTGLLY